MSTSLCHAVLARLIAACPESTQPAACVANFARLSTPHALSADALVRWIAQVRAADLPHLHAFTRGLERDRDAVIARSHTPVQRRQTLAGRCTVRGGPPGRAWVPFGSVDGCYW